MKTLGIIGSGDLGLQIAHYAISDHHYQDVVFFDDFSKEAQSGGFKIVGNSNDIENCYMNKSFDELIIAIGYKNLTNRKLMFERFDGKIPFGKIIHSSSYVDKNAKIGAGTVVYPCCSIDKDSIIDSNTILNMNCTVAHDSYVGRHCFLAPRVALAGFVRINELCMIGINAIIIDNITLSENTTIGAGTVVIKNIPGNALYVGNPQKFIR